MVSTFLQFAIFQFSKFAEIILSQELNKIKKDEDKQGNEERLKLEDRIAEMSKENLQLQKLVTLLQSQVNQHKDPERAVKVSATGGEWLRNTSVMEC